MQVMITGLAARGDLIAYALLLLRGAGGPQVSEWVTELCNSPFAIGAWVVFSTYMAAQTYYTHCKSINEAYYRDRRDESQQWKCQPEKFMTPERELEEMRLGTFNSGVATLLGMITPILSLIGSEHPKCYLYFDAAQYGDVR